MGITAGSDVYGAVRRVDQTPVVTTFAMLQFLPLFPLESYYLRRVGKKSGVTLPLLGGYSSQPIVGLRLARLSMLSVAVAYLRGLGAAMAVVGAIGVFGAGVSSLSGNAMNDEQRMITQACFLVLGSGVVIAVPTYFFLFTVQPRDELIRRACGQWLGIAADPAQIATEDARLMMAAIEEVLVERGILDPGEVLRNPYGAPRDVVTLVLLRTRAQIATRGDTEKLERECDSLLLALSSAR